MRVPPEVLNYQFYKIISPDASEKLKKMAKEKKKKKKKRKIQVKLKRRA